MSTMPAAAQSGADGTGEGGTALPPGTAPAPPPPAVTYSDRYFPPADMARARETLYREHGGGSFHQILFNLAEYQAHKRGDGFRWDGEAWFGGDIGRFVLKTEGEGAYRGGVESAEIQALYSHALDPYWNLQAGVRQDFEPGPPRTYATIGLEGLAPGMFEVEGALFLSTKGDLLARAEAYYDQRIIQRLILQPRAELNFAAQDVPENRIGSGLSNAELGLRLRYEITREFAPYIGVSWDRKTGATARYARADGETAGTTSFVAGIRTWF
jgi:copper resistance protein B